MGISSIFFCATAVILGLTTSFVEAAELSRFLPVLSVSQYQGDWNTGTRVTYQGSSLTSYPDTPYFFFDDDNNMVFTAVRENSSYTFRSELRHGPEWSVTDTSTMHLEAKLSSTTLKEYTFAQIHRKATTSVSPPLRLAWEASRKIGGITYTDYLIAVLLRDNGTYERYALAPRSNNVSAFVLQIDNKVVKVSIDGVEKLNVPVADWNYATCYFKAGVYLTGSAKSTGEATSEVSNLSIVVGGDSNDENTTEDNEDNTTDDNEATSSASISLNTSIAGILIAVSVAIVLTL